MLKAKLESASLTCHLQDAANTQRSPQPQRSHEVTKVATLLTTIRSPISPTPTSCGPAVTIIASWDPKILIMVPGIATTKRTPSPAEKGVLGQQLHG